MKKTIFYAFVLFAFSFVIMSCGGKKAETTETKTEEAAAPATETATAAVDWKTQKFDLENGKAVYAKVCMTCHLMGVSNAPALDPSKYKLEDWQKRADLGIDSLMHSALNGKPGTAMVARGTCPDCTDQDLFDAIHYMYNEAHAEIK
ncbi:MAG: c-type cytochrome [Saprospiraceae bacterium]